MEEPALLLVDGDAGVRRAAAEALGERYAVTALADVPAAIAHLEATHADVALVDADLRPLDGYAFLNWVRTHRPGLPVVMTAARATMAATVRAIHGGAHDFLHKPAELQALERALARALRVRPPARPRPRQREPEVGLLGATPQMLEVFRLVARAARSRAPVLIHGESGTGKELVARAVHEHSERAGAKFVALNCGALSDTLLESELFGHVKGAFTGAERSRNGLYAEAEGGTLFLDEVAEVSPRLQVQLLRVLQSGEYRPVGSDTTLHGDVRVVAATHRDLAALVSSGAFRQDLYYRLKVIDIAVPPLRDRPGDIPVLVDRFIQAGGGDTVTIDDDALAILESHAWPGNVRELENVVARALALSPGPSISVHDLPLELQEPLQEEPRQGAVRTLADVEQDYARRILGLVDGNKSAAARLLGVDRKTLRRVLSRAPRGSA